ncbi:MAG: hypothetical protein IID61_18700 [SAR324 cluster bacterium]|nr:hypothetical protein [SAR324 cluster bacterium]
MSACGDGGGGGGGDGTADVGGGGGGGSAQDYAIGGTVTGLSGALVLQNNGGDDLEIGVDGTFAFATAGR